MALQITPPLNAAERSYLTRFVTSRRYARVEGVYAVPLDAGLALAVTPFVRRDVIAPGQPSLSCPWRICASGCCLSLDLRESWAHAAGWLQYLLDHFLRPGALAAGEEFGEFTFDHQIIGAADTARATAQETLRLSVIDGVVVETVTPFPAARRERLLERKVRARQARSAVTDIGVWPPGA